VGAVRGSRSVLAGERKRVTVLFADVKGSMQLAEQMDAEEWSQIMRRFFALLSAGVERFEGFVDKFTGDGIMALFGAPIAHEDHARRACLAALHLRDELREYANELRLSRGLDFSVRMGINSGEVVVGEIGDDLRMEYTAQGHTVGLAQRMEQLAAAQSIYVSESTAGAAAGYVALRDLGAATIKGVSEPLQVFELVGMGSAHTRFDVSRARGLVRFVGRDGEMEVLEAALVRSRGGDGQVVSVVAEAGTGKSRLCFEFAQRCRARGLRVLEGRCVAHGRNLPLLPVLEIIRGYYGIADDDDDRTAREKVAGRMLLLEESYRAVLPLLFEFLGIPDPQHPAPSLPPEARQRQLFGALRRLMRSGPQPGQNVGIIVFEDAHWIDGGSEAWLEQWVNATAGAANLLVINFRPEYRSDWMRAEHCRRIELAPLSPQAIRELIGDLIGDDSSTAGLAERIHAHTAGNPFFAEEVVQSLIESGQLQGARGAYRLLTPIEHLDVPPSVQAVLAARIDRLAERDKRVLQIASVIGKDFDEPLLLQVGELQKGDLIDSLAVLRAAEFVQDRALYPVAEYAFKHPLTQAVALGSLLRDRRRALHAAVAGALEARTQNLEEGAALLAHHWEEAGAPLAAARWHLRAADWIGAKDVREAAGHAHAVLALLRDREGEEGATALLAQACARLLGLGWRIGMADEAARVYEDGRRWSRAAGDVDAEARLAGSYAAIVCLEGRVEESMAIGKQFPVLAEDIGDPELGLVSRTWLAYPRMRMGQFAEAEARLLAALAGSEDHPDLGVRFLGASLIGFVLTWLGSMYGLTRSWPEAQEMLERALAWTRSRREAEAESLVHQVWGWGALESAGEVSLALSHARQSVAQAEELGSAQILCGAKRTLAMCLAASGEHQAAIDLCSVALQKARERRVNLEMESQYHSVFAAALRGQGALEPALSAAREAVAVADRLRTGAFLPGALHELARVLIARGELDEAATALGRMERESRAIGASAMLPFAVWRRADLADARGDAAERDRLLRAAHEQLTVRGASGHATAIARLL
jgi:class 3 adenylate cyclase/tetratricopeptide (TPR) repeat protein